MYNVGALLVRNSSLHKLKKLYFGGGTVDGAGVDKFFHFPRHELTAWYELVINQHKAHVVQRLFCGSRLLIGCILGVMV